eukprot:TRINITY_DN37704_c0_g1_i1.p1 TRINITY_DN37704_c0_g1~~TRINITY_DN37704_c0_g1_i1.p1  ORF type:complete len:496 (+),score=92.68 TRINITY_DN37704_c0_g1_i1:110-1597(+)
MSWFPSQSSAVSAWLRKGKETRDHYLGWDSPTKEVPDLQDCIDEAFSLENFPHEDEATLMRRKAKWGELLRRFQKYGYYSTGNRVSVLEGGDEGFTRMLTAIAAAECRVWCESYIFDNSRVGEAFFRALLDAAKRGVDVVLLVDFIGSFALRSDWVSELREAGAEVVFFNPVLPQSCVGPISFRDHRKILICDDKGFCGGMNIHEEVGEEIFGTGHFYDVHVLLEGPSVADLAEVFRDSLAEAGDEVVRSPIQVPDRVPNGVYVQILQSNVRRRRRTLQKVISRAIDAADESVFLTTAYFFPPGFLRRALLRVPARKARLSLLLSGSSDFYPLPGDLMAQTYFLRRFLRETEAYEKDQVKVHLYDKRHMHAKHMSIDGVFATIGSFNFDLYSARRNLEVGIAVFDRTFAHQLQAIHQKRALEAKRTTFSDQMYHQPLVQVACGIAYGIVRISGRNIFDGLDCFQRKWLVRKAALTYLLEEQSAQFIATSMMWGLD